MPIETLEPRRPRRSVVAAVALAALSLALMRPLAAQDPTPVIPSWAFEGFAAWRENSMSTMFGGASLTKHWGALGLRLGGAVHLVPDDPQDAPLSCGRFGCRAFDSQGPNVRVGAWIADLELIFEPLRAAPDLKALLFGISPYAFGGIGQYGVRLADMRDSSVATLNYGFGAYRNVIGPVGLQGEARYRAPFHSDNGFLATAGQRLEFSAGLRVTFGGRRAKPAPPNEVSPTIEGVGGSAELASRVLDVAESYLDAPYKQGGANPYGGFDAAGFVQYVFGKAHFELGRQGVRLPRTAREMSKLGQNVPLRLGSVHPGDLLFFATDGKNIDHVAIYAGHDRIIHATASGGGVRYDILGDGDRGRWFADHLVSARRLGGSSGQKTSEPRPDKSHDAPDSAPAPTGGPR